MISALIIGLIGTKEEMIKLLERCSMISSKNLIFTPFKAHFLAIRRREISKLLPTNLMIIEKWANQF